MKMPWTRSRERHEALVSMIEELQEEQRAIARELQRHIKNDPLALALGRMIAQKELYFTKSEDDLNDPERRKKSDELGAKAIERLVSENEIRNRYG